MYTIQSVAETSAAIMETILTAPNIYNELYSTHQKRGMGFVEIWGHVAQAAEALEKISREFDGWLDCEFLDCVEDYAVRISTEICLPECSLLELDQLARKTYKKHRYE